ncbi:MAG: hypothetical protein ACFE8J_18105 [Candidatus Heimdallarchaeota archaeon]
MKTELNQLSFLDIKRDYLIFMEQTLSWFDPNLIRVLFALLIEGEALAQNQIVELTELHRATISETLTELTDPTSKFLVLQTRKKGERKKYFCPMKPETYFQTLLKEGLEVAKFSLEQVPLLINRLDALSPQSTEILRVKKFLEEYWEVNNYFHFAVTYFQDNLENYVRNPDTISQFINNVVLNEIKSINLTKLDYVETSTDNLEKIKKDFINGQATSQSAAVGKKKDLVSISLLFFLEERALTQDYIMKITGYSRSTVSVTLKTLMRLNVLQVIKKPKVRKKYYQLKYGLKENLYNTIKQFRYIFSQAKEVVKIQFIPNMEKIKGYNREKQKLKEFFEENIRFFELFEDYTDACTDVFNELISEYKPTDTA